MTPPLIWCKLDEDGPGLHEPQMEGDVGWDLEAAMDVVLYPNAQADVPCNVRVRLPDDCWGEIRARSSIARKGLQVDSGVLDTGYTGPLFVLLRNMNRRGSDGAADWAGRVFISKGERIGQLVLHYAYRATSEQVRMADFPSSTDRGALSFGSTGA